MIENLDPRDGTVSVLLVSGNEQHGGLEKKSLNFSLCTEESFELSDIYPIIVKDFLKHGGIYCIDDIEDIELMGIDGAPEQTFVEIKVEGCGVDTVLPEGQECTE